MRLGARLVDEIKSQLLCQVADIDDIVRKVRFPDWQHTSQGERLEFKKNFAAHSSNTSFTPTRNFLTRLMNTSGNTIEQFQTTIPPTLKPREIDLESGFLMMPQAVPVQNAAPEGRLHCHQKFAKH